jgi:ubiquitin carboxyl-terminal hydrolase 9/24
MWVLCCRHSDGSSKWYKFDDGEVSECKMEDEEEMKTQCFGGDYMGEVRCISLVSPHTSVV